MKKLSVVLLTAATTGLPGIAAASHDRGWAYAQVVRTEPIVHQVRISEPVQECREEPVTQRTVYRGHFDPGAVLVGGIIGGVIGHQFGKGSGKDAATVAGAVIGANHAARHSGTADRVVERTVYQTVCRTVVQTRYQERIDGYHVTYRYQGRLYRTRTSYDPGKRIRVRVDVTPVAY
jgi:uncharacterized protein YcfJ